MRSHSPRSRFGSALLAVLVLIQIPVLGADWEKGERKTVAYFWDHEAFHAMARAGWPHGERGKDGFIDFATPERLDGDPFKSRFFRERDELWLMTTGMRRLSVFGPGTSWAVYNFTSQRMVVTLLTSRPRLVPLGRNGEKNIGLLWETMVADPAGANILGGRR